VSAPAAALTLPPLSRGRRARDRAARVLLTAAVAIALVPLVLVLYYVLERGLRVISWDFFTTDPTGRFLGPAGGIRSALLGTLEIVGLATAISVPVGIGVALYLVEYGRRGRFAGVVRYFVDVMTGVPSVVFGLFIYITLVVTQVGGSFAGWKGSVALSLLMLPVVIRAGEVVLKLVPGGLREAALALGAPRWRVVLRVVLPTAGPGLVTGALLAVARAMGETAPLLFTTAVAFGATANLGDRMNSLPVQIFNDVQSAQSRVVDRAWGSALTIVALVLLISFLARLISRRSRVA
jgi:phosphate transport system permease protein